MKFVQALLVFGLLLVALPAHSAKVVEDDDDVDTDDTVQPDQTAEPNLEQGPARAPSVTDVKTPSAGPSTVNMAAASLSRFGKQSSSKVPAPAPAPQQATDAMNAHAAAESAKNAAHVANTVAQHSVKLAGHATSALKKAHDAVHEARVDSAGLSTEQKNNLKAAEAKLKEATKRAEYGQIKNAKYVKTKVENQKLQKMEAKMDKLKKDKKESSKKKNSELESMRNEIQDLREELKKKEGEKADDDEVLKDLQEEIEQMEKSEKKDNKKDKRSHDEMKAEIERLRAEIQEMDDSEPAEKPAKVEKYDVKMKPLSNSEEQDEPEEQGGKQEATPVQEKGLDIDTAMPYGDLEPFGREDTAQELTENSIQESDGMVDQLERAEVSEEKRAVFRALTRLRGAAITSFDGVARSQTGQIDEYNKVHKWRNAHPLHHLADEESDISKWAFPDNAD